VPKISVVIPIYNGEIFIPSLFLMLSQQTFKDFEVVVVNDGSEDNSLNTINELLLHYQDMNIVLIDSSHTGLAAARNIGIRNSKCDYISFLDCDDYWYPNKLELQLQAINKSSAIAVFSDIEYFDGAHLKSNHSSNLLFDCASPRDILVGHFVVFGGGSNILCKRSALELAGGFDESLDYAEDLDMWLRLAEIGEIFQIPDCLVRIGVRSDSMQRIPSTQVQIKVLQAKLLVYEKWSYLIDSDVFNRLVNEFLDSVIYLVRAKHFYQLIRLTIIWIRFLIFLPVDNHGITFSLLKRIKAFLFAVTKNLKTRNFTIAGEKL
jgi:glycosyltransferase involved in cell wall biosynthesis